MDFMRLGYVIFFFFFFQAEDGIRDVAVTGVQTCALPIYGCFDTLHVGHIRYLEGARREGDIVVVGVNDDSSVRNLKGPGRPILDQKARAHLVAALRAVDYVVLFSEASVEALLEELRPDVHAKGTDYTAETVPERATAARLGIRVGIAGDPQDHPTPSFL